MSVKLIVAIVAVAGLLFLGTAVYANGSGMGWGYGGQMMGGFGWGHHHGYGPYPGNGVCYQQGRADQPAYYGDHRGPGYHYGQTPNGRMPHGWNNGNGTW